MNEQEIRQKLIERQGAAELRDAMDEEVSRLSKELKEELMARQVRTLDPGGDWLPVLIAQERKTINKTKLLSLGVPADTIVAATEITPVEMLRVNKRGQGNGSGSGS
jgi:hypothetical protein